MIKIIEEKVHNLKEGAQFLVPLFNVETLELIGAIDLPCVFRSAPPDYYVDYAVPQKHLSLEKHEGKIINKDSNLMYKKVRVHLRKHPVDISAMGADDDDEENISCCCAYVAIDRLESDILDAFLKDVVQVLI